MKKLILSALMGAAAMCAQQVDWSQIKNKPNADASEFSWYRTSGIAVTANLSASGSGKLITLLACPRGLTAGTPVRIDQGTGTGESAAITSTTCTLGGGLPGTITLTTANTHTGAWRIGTATAGIKEAFNSGARSVTAGADGAVLTAYANVVVDDNYSTLHVRGWGIDLAEGASIVLGSASLKTGISLKGEASRTFITSTTTGGATVEMKYCRSCALENLFLERSATPAVSGGYGLWLNGTDQAGLVVNNLTAKHHYVNVQAEGPTVTSGWTNIFVESAVSHNLWFKGTNGENITNLLSNYAGGHSLFIGNGSSTTYCIGGFRLTNAEIYNSTGDGIHIEGAGTGDPTYTTCSYNFFTNIHPDTDGGYEFYAKYASAITIAGSEFINGKGMYLDHVTDVAMSGVRIGGSTQEGLYITNSSSYINGAGVSVVNNSRTNDSVSYGIRINNSVTDVNFSGTQIASPYMIQAGGILVETGTGAPNNIVFSGTNISVVGPNLPEATAVTVTGGTNVFIDYGWQSITLNNGWTEGISFKCHLTSDGLVNIRGTIIPGTRTNGTSVATLPTACRPSLTRGINVVSLNSGGTPASAAQIEIANTGNMAIYNMGGTDGYLRFDGNSFSK